MISFRYIKESDYSLISQWLSYEFVSRWYKLRSVLYNDVENKYFNKKDEYAPIEGFIIDYNKTPIGYAQTYRLIDYKGYFFYLSDYIDVATSGMDLFIGEKDYLGRGLGTLCIKKFVKKIVFIQSGISSCIAGVDSSNKSSFYAYKNAGFKKIGVVSHGVFTECILKKEKK